LLNASHPIYEAHFAGNPVTPGACIVLIIKELAEEFLNRTLHIAAVKNTKFLNTIHPVINHEITVEIKLQTLENNNFSLSSTVFDKDTTFAKSILYLK
jgi:3-hydroxyacyl-[acyl-carrier-protein] dehydratase